MREIQGIYCEQGQKSFLAYNLCRLELKLTLRLNLYGSSYRVETSGAWQQASTCAHCRELRFGTLKACDVVQPLAAGGQQLSCLGVIRLQKEG